MDRVILASVASVSSMGEDELHEFREKVAISLVSDMARLLINDEIDKRLAYLRSYNSAMVVNSDTKLMDREGDR